MVTLGNRAVLFDCSRLSNAGSTFFRAWLSQILATSSMSGLKVLLCLMGRPGQRSKASTGVGLDARSVWMLLVGLVENAAECPGFPMRLSY